MPEIAPRLTAAAEALGLRLSPKQAARLAAYAEGVLSLNRRLNLTGARDAEQLLSVLVLPSLGIQVAWPADGAPPRRVIDIGSGNGFPGVAAAALWPRAQVLLVERRRKKARAMGTCLASAGITNAQALGCDAREVKNRRPDVMGTADLVTLRAVGPLADTTHLAAPFLAPGGRIVHWKGENLDAAERAEGAEAARAHGLRIADPVPQPDGRGVFIIYVRPDGASA